MSWFSSRGAGSGDRQGKVQGPQQAPPAAPEEHRSLALSALLGDLGGRSRLQVLDLGPAIGGNVEFLSQFGCKLYIQDLFSALGPHLALLPGTPADPIALSLGSAISADHASVREARETWEAREKRAETLDEAAGVSARLSGLLAFPADTRFDAVLAWDLLNYLDRHEMVVLARLLARFCRPGALLFALISILKKIPAEPMRFRILDQERLSYETRTAATRPCPRYAPAELNELLRGFRPDRSFLLRHGIQEFLFARESD